MQGLINEKTFLYAWTLLFRYLHKQAHTKFFIFFNLVINLILNVTQYKKIKTKSKIKGLKLIIKGRLQGKMRASLKCLQDGKIPSQSIDKYVTVVKHSACTVYGVYGLTLWIYKA